MACITCHPAAGFLERLKVGERTSLNTEMLRYKGSAHDQLRCLSCHPGTNAGPHPSKPVTVACLSCHGPEGELAGRSKVGIDLLHKQTGPNAPRCLFCHGYHGVVDPTNPKEVYFRSHIPDLCATCHNDPAKGQQGIPQAAEYWQGVHSKTEQSKLGLQRDASCTDCHYMHASNRNPNVMLFPARTRETAICGRCHVQPAQGYTTGVHGTALRAHPQSLPICTDCHGTHDVLGPKDPKSLVSRQHVVQTCDRCHADKAFAAKFGLDTVPATTYRSSYHGVAQRFGNERAPTCVQCHNSHDIRRSSDPAAWTNPTNLSKTCGQCHPGALRGKVTGRFHVTARPDNSLPVFLITLIYVLLVSGSMLGFVAFIGLDLAAHRRLEKAGIEERFHHLVSHLPRPPERSLLRMMPFERLNHIALTVSFIVLAITGIAVLVPDGIYGRTVIALCGGMSGRAIVHRVAAGVLILVFVGYAVWMAFTPRGRDKLRRLLPGVNDLRDLLQTVMLFLGRTQNRPSFARYSFPEKFEFWALVWGTTVMTVTGLLLALINWTLGTVPKWVLDISEVIHKWEALLAVGAIAVWHMYHVVWKPGVFPGNRSWLTGRIEFEEFIREHPQDYAEAMGWLPGGQTTEEPPSPDEGAPS